MFFSVHLIITFLFPHNLDPNINEKMYAYSLDDTLTFLKCKKTMRV